MKDNTVLYAVLIVGGAYLFSQYKKTATPATVPAGTVPPVIPASGSQQSLLLPLVTSAGSILSRLLGQGSTAPITQTPETDQSVSQITNPTLTSDLPLLNTPVYADTGTNSPTGQDIPDYYDLTDPANYS